MSTAAKELFMIMLLQAGPWPERTSIRDLRDRRVQWFQDAGLIDGYTDNNWTDSPFYSWMLDHYFESGTSHVAINVTKEQVIDYLDQCMVSGLAPSA